MVSTQPATPQMVCEVAKNIITPANLIAELSAICENRYHAIAAYPHAKNASEKFDSIQVIRYHLELAKLMPNYREQVKACLRLERRFFFLAPTRTYKLHETYISKVEAYMSACRECLGWKKQD